MHLVTVRLLLDVFVYKVTNMTGKNITSSATAKATHGTIRSVTVVDRITITITLNRTCTNFISLIQLSVCGIMYPAMLLCQLTR